MQCAPFQPTEHTTLPYSREHLNQLLCLFVGYPVLTRWTETVIFENGSIQIAKAFEKEEACKSLSSVTFVGKNDLDSRSQRESREDSGLCTQRCFSHSLNSTRVVMSCTCAGLMLVTLHC